MLGRAWRQTVLTLAVISLAGGGDASENIWNGHQAARMFQLGAPESHSCAWLSPRYSSMLCHFLTQRTLHRVGVDAVVASSHCVCGTAAPWYAQGGRVANAWRQRSRFTRLELNGRLGSMGDSPLDTDFGVESGAGELEEELFPDIGEAADEEAILDQISERMKRGVEFVNRSVESSAFMSPGSAGNGSVVEQLVEEALRAPTGRAIDETKKFVLPKPFRPLRALKDGSATKEVLGITANDRDQIFEDSAEIASTLESISLGGLGGWQPGAQKERGAVRARAKEEERAAAAAELARVADAGGRFDLELSALREEEDHIVGDPLRQRARAALEARGADPVEALLATERLRASSFGPEWPAMLDALASLGLDGGAMAQMLVRYPSLLTLAAARLFRIAGFLQDDVGISCKSVRYILSRRPSLIAAPVDGLLGLRASALALQRLGVEKGNQLRNLVATNPGVLAISARQMERVSEAVCIFSGGAETDGLSPSRLGPLIRKAPWMLLYDADEEIPAVLEALQSLENLDIDRVLRSFPDVLGLDVDAQVLRVFNTLLGIGLEVEDVAAVIESFPRVLGASVDVQLLPVIEYLQRELGISRADLCKIVRAFPATLTLDVDADILPKVQFLRDIGVTNVGRIVTLLPPILGLDVSTQLMPKMRFLDKVGLSAFDMARFPQFFAYPLQEIIRPRLLFLAYLEIPLTSKPLEWLIAPTDKDFCELTLGGVSVEVYERFRCALPPIEMPPPPRRKRQSPRDSRRASVAFSRDSHAFISLQLKGDPRYPGYKRRLRALLEAMGGGSMRSGREIWDSEKEEWIWEGAGESPLNSLMMNSSKRKADTKVGSAFLTPDGGEEAREVDGSSGADGESLSRSARVGRIGSISDVLGEEGEVGGMGGTAGDDGEGVTLL